MTEPLDLDKWRSALRTTDEGEQMEASRWGVTALLDEIDRLRAERDGFRDSALMYSAMVAELKVRPRPSVCAQCGSAFDPAPERCLDCGFDLAPAVRRKEGTEQ